LKETEHWPKRSLISIVRSFRAKLFITQDSVLGAIRYLKKIDDTGPIVLIKAYKKANYGNFVDILDEMNICGIARYTVVNIAWFEEKMVETASGITTTKRNFNQLTVNL